MQAPCRNCDKRHMTCHTDCPLYIEFVQEHNKEKQRIQILKEQSCIARNFKKDGVLLPSRRRGRNHK